MKSKFFVSCCIYNSDLNFCFAVLLIENLKSITKINHKFLIALLNRPLWDLIQYYHYKCNYDPGDDSERHAGFEEVRGSCIRRLPLQGDLPAGRRE